MRLYFRGKRIRLTKKQEIILARRIIALVLLLTIATLTVVTLYNKAAPIAMENAPAITRTKWEAIIMAEVRSILQTGEYTYQSFAVKTLDEVGKITSLSVNSREVTNVCAAISERLNQIFWQNNKLKIAVPIGSVLCPSLLHGVGFNISVNAMAYTSVSVRIVSEVSSIGINQTMHRLSARIQTDTRLYCSSRTSTISHTYDVILAESVAFGSIPNSYFEYGA